MKHSASDHEQVENERLAPYAARSGATHGRKYPESSHDYRTDFQRDRDRIIYSSCFRRLEYKTQVFINGTADHYRTRLTHTFEMTAISRTLARVLKANEDLAETIALAHDIGHSPFGHSGERELDDLMKEHGGFNHNTQSLRWVEELEPRYPNHPGLNLTWEVRAGLRKHLSAEPGAELDGRPIGPHQYVEAQIADVADDIAYYAHDVEDGLEAGLITVEQLEELAIWRRAGTRARERFPDLPADMRTPATNRCLLDLLVSDVIDYSTAQLEKFNPQSPADAMNAPERVVAFSPEIWKVLKPHREFLYGNLYYHQDVEEANTESVHMMSRLFQHYVSHPEVMGGKARGRIETNGLWRTACDYVAGMTDRYAIQEYRRFGLHQQT